MSQLTSLTKLAAVAVGALGLWAIAPAHLTSTISPVGAALAQDATPDTAAEAPVVEIRDMTLGPADAKVTLIEYASYTCPFCATFHDTVFKELKRDYIDTGKIQFVYREVYFDRYGLWAAMVARCGGDMKYFAIQDMLYDDSQAWAASDDPNVVVANLKTIGRTAGMEDAQIDACLQDGPKAQAMLDRFEASMQEHDVQGTPTLIINGTKHSNMAYAELRTILDAELAE